ncbi:PAS domain-containing hybrid sensor histidine kinase/response regulator [Pedobacter xixiisoli]|uniref:PAS domain-containing hybrid sensor histidine kinase/response regulator n=1 Tax=Pedobacter xixiisoli TaxID=1476464 RepID=UPI00118644B5|nr:PAS domain-containing hybrid sensor histidine kinase/response regulator [Pedobacter xixiisoli]
MDKKKDNATMLQASSEILTEMASMAKIGVWELDVLQIKARWSEEAFRIHGALNATDADIEQIEQGYTPEALLTLKSAIDEAINEGLPFDLELPFNHPLNKRTWIRMMGKPMKENGKTVKLYGAFLDVSARKETERNLIKAKELAEDADKLKTEFLSTMSHEIRTPLNAIIGFTDLLLVGETLPHQIESLNILKFSANNLMDLINDILDYHKIQSGKLGLEVVAINIRELLEHTLGYFKRQLEHTDVELNVRIASEVPQWVNGDRTRLAQVLTNLMTNAVKFTKKGSITVGLTTKKEGRVDFLVFSVADTGIGIAKEKLGLIFESFTQGSRDTTRKYGGTGLGLAISKKLIELQGGSIDVASKHGIGSTFTVCVPFLVPKNHQQSTVITEDDSLNGKHILLVEDNEVNVMLVSRLLKRWGVTFDVAENGQVAVDQTIERDYDLVLMDLHMPVMDGYQATRKIRQLEGAQQRVPIVALTASAVTVVREDMIQQGFDELVYKPYPPKELFAKLKMLLS